MLINNSNLGVVARSEGVYHSFQANDLVWRTPAFRGTELRHILRSLANHLGHVRLQPDAPLTTSRGRA